MSRTKISLYLTVIIISLTMLPQVAFSYKEHASAGHAESSVTQLEIIDEKIGTGEEAVTGDTVNVHYTGWLYDANAPENKGKKFDSSHDRDDHFSFLLGAGRVIKGWDKGVTGMKVGGQRTLIIPPSMAYGARGAGNVIPPNAALIFDVELVGLQESPHH
ncbi:MAG: hypothetical protein NMNS01_21460 [Nitrosomonas sp.]|jgi:FKBP-type peptidyl-prolyl cis-trans isomerase FkpA|nr:MAG: hypothetical protein NMNS01_21460 [Nitrosomonas sp.]